MTNFAWQLIDKYLNGIGCLKIYTGMKKIMLCLAFLLLSAAAVNAQKLVIGEKTPDIRVSAWLTEVPVMQGKATLIDFFHSSNEQSVRGLAKLNDFAKRYEGRLNVIVLNKEGFENVSQHLNAQKGYVLYMGFDEGGRIFAAYDVRFVPFSVLLDFRGRLVWTGNVNSLTDDIIKQALR